MVENIFYANRNAIVRIAYGSEDEPNKDWQTAIDVWLKSSHAAEGMNPNRVAQQRSDFLRYVQGKRFDKDGNQI